MEVNTNLSEKAQRDFLLVQQATRGDQKAYAELMGRYRDAIYYMLLKMVNNASDAEDLTIEAFGKAFKNIQQYTPPENIVAAYDTARVFGIYPTK